MENEELSTEENEQDTTEELLETYERRRKNKAEDVIATQAVLCILIGALFVCGRIFYPQVTGEVFGRLRELVTDSSFVIANPIDLIMGLLDKH